MNIKKNNKNKNLYSITFPDNLSPYSKTEIIPIFMFCLGDESKREAYVKTTFISDNQTKHGTRSLVFPYVYASCILLLYIKELDEIKLNGVCSHKGMALSPYWKTKIKSIQAYAFLHMPTCASKSSLFFFSKRGCVHTATNTAK